MIRTEVYESGRKGGKAQRSFRVKEFESQPSNSPAVLKLHVCICIYTGLSKSSERMAADKRIKRPEGRRDRVKGKALFVYKPQA